MNVTAHFNVGKYRPDSGYAPRSNDKCPVANAASTALAALFLVVMLGALTIALLAVSPAGGTSLSLFDFFIIWCIVSGNKK